MGNDIDKASDILIEAIELNDISDGAACAACMRIFTGVMILQKIDYETFCEGLEKLKKDYKNKCDALEIR
jgi:hypothetical protein